MLKSQFEQYFCCYRNPSPFHFGSSVVVKCVTEHVQENAAHEMCLQISSGLCLFQEG